MSTANKPCKSEVPNPHSFVLRFAATILLLGTASLATPAQQPKVMAPHKPVAPKLTAARPFDPPAQQSAVGGLWMTDGNMKSSLYLKSDLKTSSLTVTPILYLSNGVRYPLSAVTLEPSGTAIVDINQALAQQGIAPYATLYGYVEIDYQWPWAVVCGSIRNVDFVNSLIFTNGLQPPPSGFPKNAVSSGAQTMHSFEGLWWKQESNVSGFVALANITEQPINATVRLTDSNDTELESDQTTISPHSTKMVTLTQLKLTSSISGGIYLTHDGTEHGLAINGGLEDQSVGYSARLPLMPSPEAPAAGTSPAASDLAFAELGLMSGAADPMMNFPSGTVFTPYSLVRNISGQSATVTPTLWWMVAGTPTSAQLSKVTIAPHRTLNLNVPALIAAAGIQNFNGSFNVVLDTNGQSGAFTTAAGSVDKKNTYVFEVIPHQVTESASRSIPNWSTANGDDTMITLWNPADEDQDLVYTLFFSGGHYLYPIHLAARATRTFNISEITGSATPDSEGNIIPAGIRQGSAEIAGSLGEHQHILVNMDTGVYNVNKAVCAPPVCETCQGEVSVALVDNPFAVAVSGTKQQTFYMTWNSGFQFNLTSQGTWSSNATNIATVSGGLVNGVSPGSVTVSFFGPVEPPYIPNYCYMYGNGACPAGGPASGSGPGITRPVVTSISPTWGQVGTTVPVTISGTGFGTGGTVGFSGSGISVTYGTRNDTTINATFTIAPNASVGFQDVTVTNNTTVDGSKPTSDPVSFQVTPTTAVPVNFRIAAVNKNPFSYPIGTLEFVYYWDSSTGNIADLANCSVGEIANYPVQSPDPTHYHWTQPPYTQPVPQTTNPFPSSAPATNILNAPYNHAGAVDDHYYAGFQTPYAPDNFTVNQYYRFQCSNYQSGAWTNMVGPISIQRTVTHNANGTWRYDIYKSNQTNSVNPMP